ncbi:MAG TPA: peptidylprolyl isomerase, partial [Candidatus Baltobacteraceae bacterium]
VVMSNRTRLCATVLSLSLLVLAACSSAGTAASTTTTSSGDVASVNGEKISRDDFVTKIEALQQAKGVLNQMVQSALIDQYAKANNVTVADADVQKKEDTIRANYPPGQFEQILARQGLTEDDVKKILREQLVIEQAVGKDVHVSDDDIKKFIATNHATLDTPEQARARHILVADLPTAQQVEAKLKSGAKFEDLAKQYSTDPSTKDKGGELGFFNKGAMVPEFEKAAFSQPIGEIGPPVKSPFGYHIIQVEDRKQPTVATFASANEKVREQLKQQQEQTLIPAFLQGLRAKATIEIYDPALKDALPPIVSPAATPAAAPAAPASAAPAAKSSP